MNMDDEFGISFSELSISPPVPKPRRSLQRNNDSSTSASSGKTSSGHGEIYRVYDSSLPLSNSSPHSRHVSNQSRRGRGRAPQIRTPHRIPPQRAFGRRESPLHVGLPTSNPHRRSENNQNSSSHMSKVETPERRNFRRNPFRGRRSASNQRPDSVHEAGSSYSNSVDRESPQHRSQQRRSSSRQRNPQERGQDFPRRDDQPRAIGYKTVEQMVNDDDIPSRNIALRLTANDFVLRLKSDLHHGWIQLILKLFAKMSRSDDPNHYFNRALAVLIHHEFHLKIIAFLTNTLQGQRVNKENACTHLTNTLLLLRSWLLYVPGSSQLAAEILLPFLKTRVQNLGLTELEEISGLLTETEELLQECTEKEQQQHDPDRPMNLHEEEPPDDFRSLSVFPTKNDIHDDDPFVRVNLTSKAYKNPDHYLDVQFRLLREDFVRPLREGISDYYNSKNFTPGKKKQRLEGIRIYQNVNIEFPKLSPKGITYCLHFDIERLRFVQWQNSKRLLFGNLVCLSSDDFMENFLFASITNRDADLLRDGYIEVEFWNCEGTAAGLDNADDEFAGGANRGDENSSCLITAEDMKQTYAMAESEAYFEAYRHVLSGLQETRTIPLRQYIVDCAMRVDSPAYLRGLGRTATYDFSCIMNSTDDKTSSNTYNVLDTYRWPDAQTLGLDHSQVAALESALTKELSIIQGPPGTGKTYVGLMIMKILLSNRNSSADKNNRRNVVLPDKSVPDGPILVVCYTNHALDQFLEGIARFNSKGLIRVGGRGKNKELEKYNLANVRRSAGTDKFTRKMFYDLRCELEAQVAAVEESQAILKASTDSILGLQILMPVIDPRHLQQLENLINSYQGSSGYDKALLQWLGVSKKAYQIPDEMSFVIEETLAVVLQQYELEGISRNRVLQAIVCTEHLDPFSLSQCLLDHYNHDDYEPLVNSDIVCRFLESYEVEVNMTMLVARRFSPLEVKCACFVLTSNPLNRMMVQNLEGAVIDWISKKRAVEAEDTKFMEEKGEGANVEEEANVVEDQRMIDGEDDFMMQIDRKGRRQKSQSRTNITAAKHDEIHFQTDANADLQGGFRFQRGELRRMQKDLRRRLKREMTKQDTLSEVEVKSIGDIFFISSEQKWKLYRTWVRRLLAIHRKKMSKTSKEYNRLTRALNDLRNREAFDVLKTADVIAMTTTGAAKYRDMVYKLPIQIMIVEEAAEVLEAHIVTSMPQTTQHLILIGDHQQLKPSPTVYDLATKYGLDMSLFERMVKNNIPCSKLELQHRMRPRIADLVRPHIYKVLRDHESVMTYDDVIGVQSNVFFLSHEHLEDNVMDSKSKVNQHEADFMIGLCQYLLQQGYEASQITILTAYVGQLLAFKKSIARKLHQKVRITAVDNFQGEENDIILLSLVRSNEQGKIGFLSIENRVCVALSRAKKGLYCIGNFELLKEKSPLWKNILTGLERDDLTGDAMPLKCKNHPETIIKVKCLDDFKRVPEGGCGKPCLYRLDCGHVCTRLCHPDDSEHQKYVCKKQTEKECPKGHKTTLKCYQKLECKVLVETLMPKCQHYMDVQCSKDPEMVTCTKPCAKKLPCEHNCPNICGVKCAPATMCRVKIKIDAACKHRVEVPCGRKDFNVRDCREKCNEVLKCGHVCRGTCGKCKQGRLHVGCSNNKCGRMLSCGHICQEKCTAVCPPCQRKCETSCKHSQCKRLCCEPCVLCTEKCNWKCVHYQCTKLCSEPCNRPPCNEPCSKILSCGHPCIGLCGEPCPKLCRVCNKDKVEEIFFGDEDEPDARFVQLECGHVFTYEGLDTWMKQKNVDDSSETDIKLKECPRCKTPIRKSTRYGNIVNKTLITAFLQCTIEAKRLILTITFMHHLDHNKSANVIVCAINEVREKIAGSPAEVIINRKALLEALEENILLKTHIPLLFEKLVRGVMSAKSNPSLSVIEFQYDCLSEIASVKDKLSKITSSSSNVYRNDLNNRMREIEEWLMRNRSYFSEQEKEDLRQERQRCKDSLKFIQVKHKLSTLTLSSVDNIEQLTKLIMVYLFDDLFPYSSLKQDKINRAFKLMDRMIPDLLPGLGITDDERKMILKAIDLSPGHWFKCKNGHVYCIGECGGAVEESKCPECKADIGGTSHTLNPTNRLASEMDGATAPTWNPNNFDIPQDVREWMRGDN